LLESVGQSPYAPPAQFVLAAREPTINPGAIYKKVMVSSGMMGFVRSDNELAMILGHELAHITKGHVSRGATNNARLSIASTLASAVFPGSGLAPGLLGELFLDHFNQEQELAADRVGLHYAAYAGYDPRAGGAVMRRMAEEVPHSANGELFLLPPLFG
jgi:predicted Zn-dependent protease